MLRSTACPPRQVRSLRELHEAQQAGMKEVREEMLSLQKVAEEIRAHLASTAGGEASRLPAGGRPGSGGRPGVRGRESEVGASLSSHA